MGIDKGTKKEVGRKQRSKEDKKTKEMMNG